MSATGWGGPKLLLSVAEAATALGVCPTTVRALTDRGEIASVRIGRRRLYRPEDLRSFTATLAAPRPGTVTPTAPNVVRIDTPRPRGVREFAPDGSLVIGR